MKIYFGLGSLLCLLAAPVILAGESLPTAQTTVDFGRKLQAWDGFGVHYVEVRHTRDYKVWREDYGGFKYLSPGQREQMIQHRDHGRLRDADRPGGAAAERFGDLRRPAASAQVDFLRRSGQGQAHGYDHAGTHGLLLRQGPADLGAAGQAGGTQGLQRRSKLSATVCSDVRQRRFRDDAG